MRQQLACTSRPTGSVARRRLRDVAPGVRLGIHKNCLWTVRERLGTLGPEVAPTLCRSPKLPESKSVG
jgi:hypothetical protein